MRYLAIDYGTKSTGLAICDPSETIVSPLLVLPNPKNLLDKIAEIIEAESVEAVVLGLPLNMDGSAGPQAKLVEGFADKLKKMVTVPIYFQDERLTTFAAEGKLVERDLTRKKKKKRLDAVAAAEILQAFLDSKKPLSTDNF
jgi:putative Holliday junction resolvase